MGLFDRFKSLRESDVNKDEADLLRVIANLTPRDIDKLVDIAKNNRDVTQDSKSMTDYYELLRSAFSSSNINTVGNTPHTRNQRYEIYEEMDESTAYISSALDIMSDDATQADEDGVIIHIKSESEKIEALVRNFIEEFELEDKVAKWARAIAKYGDLFLKVEGDYTEGITYINDTIYPGLIDRRDMNGKLVAFISNQNTIYNSDDLYAPWEFIHFRHKGDIYKEESNYARLGILGEDQFDKNLTSAYGQSILRPAIKTYSQLRFVENMLLLSRLTNSIRRNIFLINVGDVAPDKAFETIANYASLLKKDINFNVDEEMYGTNRHTVNYDEDIFIPVGDPQNDVRIESIGGDVDMKEQYDLEYLLNKLFASLKIPKAYLNYEQDLNARSTLIQLDIRYARSVSQLQHTIVSGLRRLLNIHLAYLGFDPFEIDLDIKLTSVSAIDEEARVNQQQAQINAARDMWDLLGSIKGELSQDSDTPIDLKIAAEHILSDYLELDREVVNQILGKKENITSKKIYSGTDLHAMYPCDTNNTAFSRIRESIISSIDEEKEGNI